MKTISAYMITLAIIIAFMVPTTINAAITTDSYHNSTAPLASNATRALRHVFMHNTNFLDSMTIEVLQQQQHGDVDVLLLSLHAHPNLDFNTEYYAVTLDTLGNVVDGTLLGYQGDAINLKLPHVPDDMVFQPDMSVKCHIKNDTIEVKRTYEFYTSSRGGRYLQKNGNIICSFLVTPSGLLTRLPVQCYARETTGDANYLSKDHQLPVSRSTTGEFYSLGMEIMELAQAPISVTPDFNNWDSLAQRMMEIIERYGENAPKNSETLNVMEFARWMTIAALRNGNDFLTWMQANASNEHLSHFLEATLQEGETGEAQWLQERVNALKNKKVRKWWQKWMKTHAISVQ